jgi:hypothetical protein
MSRIDDLIAELCPDGELNNPGSNPIEFDGIRTVADLEGSGA